MKRAECTNCCKGGGGMTDRQFLHHLEELLALAKRSTSLDEFVKELEKLISSYRG